MIFLKSRKHLTKWYSSGILTESENEVNELKNKQALRSVTMSED